jgi:hypothetical protein
MSILIFLELFYVVRTVIVIIITLLLYDYMVLIYTSDTLKWTVLGLVITIQHLNFM